MNKELINKIGDILSVSFGLAVIFSHKFMARYAVHIWQKRFSIDINEKIYKTFFLVVGLLLFIWGILSLFGVIKSK